MSTIVRNLVSLITWKKSIQLLSIDESVTYCTCGVKLIEQISRDKRVKCFGLCYTVIFRGLVAVEIGRSRGWEEFCHRCKNHRNILGNNNNNNSNSDESSDKNSNSISDSNKKSDNESEQKSNEEIDSNDEKKEKRKEWDEYSRAQ